MAERPNAPRQTGDVEAPLSGRDKIVAAGLAVVLAVIVIGLFRLTLGFLYGWTF